MKYCTWHEAWVGKISLSKTETRSRYKSFVLLISSLPIQHKKKTDQNEPFQALFFSCQCKSGIYSFLNYQEICKRTVKLPSRLIWHLKDIYSKTFQDFSSTAIHWCTENISACVLMHTSIKLADFAVTC